MIAMKKCKALKLNNKGAAMVMVIVVIAFVSILTTVLLYLANMNYQMKSTDFKTKVSFYGAETPLEELRVLLTKDVSDAAKLAYQEVELDYANLSEDDRMVAFQDKFVDNYLATWETRTADVADPTNHWDWVDGYYRAFAMSSSHSADYHVVEESAWESAGNKCPTAGCSDPYHIIIVDDDTIADTNRMSVITDSSTNEMNIQLAEIKVVYTEESFSSIVSTKYSIKVPELVWSVSKSDTVWDDASDQNGVTNAREEVNIDKSVVYKDWTKQ